MFLICCSLLSFSVTYSAPSIYELQREADKAFMKEDTSLAERKYQELLEQLAPMLLEQKHSDVLSYYYIDALERLSSLYRDTKRLQEALNTLQWGIRSLKDPETIIPIEIAKAKIVCQMNRMPDALAGLIHVSKLYPLTLWTQEAHTFYNTLRAMVHHHFELLLAKGHHLILLEDYTQALSVYQSIQEQILPLVEQEDPDYLFFDRFIQYKISCIHYQKKEFEAVACELLDKPSSLDLEHIYLAAHAYTEQKKYQDAITYFLHYLKSNEHHPLPHFHQAILELSILYIQTQDTRQAQELLTTLQRDPTATEEIKTIAALHLVRIALENNKLEEASSLLNDISSDAHLHPLHAAETMLLRGKLACARHQFAEGKYHLERALQQPGLAKAWKAQATFLYAILCIDESRYNLSLLSQAKQLLYSLQTSDLWSESTLYLAYIAIVESRAHHQPHYLETLRALFLDITPFSPTQKALAYLFQAEAFPSEREMWYQKSIDPSFAQDPIYPFCLYQYALYLLRTRPLETAEQAKHYLELAVEHTPSVASPLSKLLSHSEPIIVHRTWLPNHELLEALLLYFSHEYLETPLSLENPSLNQYLLYIMGIKAYQKKEFSTALDLLHKIDTDHPYKPNALLWEAKASRALTHTGEDLFSFIYQNYPDHSIAPEAYFHYYPEESYSRGDLEALEHLSSLMIRYPTSPFALIGEYFLGKHAKDTTKASRLSRVITYDCSLLDSPLSSWITVYQHQARLELAKYCLHAGCYVEAWEHCDTLIAMQQEYNALFAEALYLQGKIALQENNIKCATDVFKKITTYPHNPQQVGVFVAMSWIELGHIAHTHADIETALECLKAAEQSEALSPRQQLQLWMEQSSLYILQNQFPTAIQMLSKVINANVASSLRIEAMFKRAEIYMLQGRNDLAIRQLESVIKQGGIWGEKARDILQKEYGIIPP